MLKEIYKQKYGCVLVPYRYLKYIFRCLKQLKKLIKATFTHKLKSFMTFFFCFLYLLKYTEGAIMRNDVCHLLEVMFCLVLSTLTMYKQF